jgi:hypothetical protein
LPDGTGVLYTVHSFKTIRFRVIGDNYATPAGNRWVSMKSAFLI